MRNSYRLKALVLLGGIVALATPALADKNNNVLTIGAQAESFTLDPAMGVGGNDYPFLYTIFDRLINLDPATLEPKPGLAESWEFTGADKQTFQFKLRQNLKFQDGTPVDAQAVKESLQHFIDAKRIQDLDVVKDIQVIDPLTVALKMDRQYSPILYVLADRAGMISSPTAMKKFGKDYDRNPVGAGPFRVKTWNAGTNMELSAFPDYWDKKRIRLAGINFKFIANGTSLISAAITGQVDFTYNLDPKNYPILKDNKNVRVKVEPSLAYNQISMHLGVPPLDNVKVRQALAMSIDREALAKVALGDMKTEGTTAIPVPPSSYAADPAYQKAFEYNPQKAKQILADAGFPNGITLKICATPGYPGFGTDMTDVEREQMKPAGITLDVSAQTVNACLQALNMGKEFHLAQGGFSGRPTPFMTYQQHMGSTGQYNKGKVTFPGVDQLIDQIAATYTIAEQKPLYSKLDKAWVDNLPIIPLFFRGNLSVYSKSVSGEDSNAQGKPDPTSLYFITK